MNSKKRAVVQFSIAIIILALNGLWVFGTTKPFDEVAYGIMALMLLMVGFAVFSGIQALKDARSGLNPVDEFSKLITEKAAAVAFKMSIFIWLFGLFAMDMFGVDSLVEFKFAIVIGMTAMGLIFLFTRLYLSRVGIDGHTD